MIHRYLWRPNTHSRYIWKMKEERHQGSCKHTMNWELYMFFICQQYLNKFIVQHIPGEWLPSEKKNVTQSYMKSTVKIKKTTE